MIKNNFEHNNFFLLNCNMTQTHNPIGATISTYQLSYGVILFNWRMLLLPTKKKKNKNWRPLSS